MRRWGYFCAILFVCCFVHADILTVPRDYGTIQEAIDAAADGDTVVVDPNTYYESLDMDGKAITLQSTDPNDPAVIASTILDGGGDNRVILCMNSEAADTVILGLTIQNGNPGSSSGGGIYCYNSSPTIRNCVFINNAAGYGGAIYCYKLGDLGDPLIVNCIFIGNAANSQGGGIYARNSMPTIINCTFTGNSADNGGGLALRDTSPLIANCTFSGNTAGTGGGLYSGSNSDPTVTNCIFWGNSATTRPEIYVYSTSDPVIRYSVAQGCGGSGAGWKSWYGIDGGYNLDADPLFADADGVDNTAGTVDDDLHITMDSPCVNAGDPNGNYAEQVDMDLLARVRYSRVDIGADELFFIGSDLNFDGKVDVSDLALFLDSENWLVEVDLADFARFAQDWLLGAGDVMDGDLSGNGCVDMTDLMLFFDGDGWLVVYDLDYFSKLASNWLDCDD